MGFTRLCRFALYLGLCGSWVGGPGAFAAGEDEVLGDMDKSDAESSEDLPRWAVGLDTGVFFNRAKASMGIGPSVLVAIDPDTAAIVSYQEQTKETKNKSRSSSYATSTPSGSTTPVVKSWESETNLSGIFKVGVRRMFMGPLFFDFEMAIRQATSTYQFDYENSTGDGRYQALGFWFGAGPGVEMRNGSIVTTVKVADLLVPTFRYSRGESFNRGDSNATSPSAIFENEAKDNAKTALSEVMFQVVSATVAFGAP